MKRIKLTQNKYAIVDDSDYKELSKYEWCYKPGYVFRFIKYGTRDYGIMQMHRQIMGLKRGDKELVDHINHNTLDNRKNNLRLCNNSQNQMNRKKTSGSSKYKGVCWCKTRKIWMSYIMKDGKSKTLGRFDKEKEAAVVYNKAACRMFGEFALLNKV